MSLAQIDALLKKLSEGTKGSYPFADKAKQYRGYSDAELAHAKKDASDASKSMRGHDVSAENWYRDDVATIDQEIERRRGKTKTEDGTVEPHDALAADPDYKSVTPREQNFLQNFLGTATGHNTNDRMNFHNDVKSYGYKNVAKLTKLFSKHYPAFSASAQKGEARTPIERIDALLKKLTETMAGTIAESEKSGVESSYKGHEIKVVAHERGLKNVLYIDGKEKEAGFFSVGAAQKYGEKLIDDPEK